MIKQDSVPDIDIGPHCSKPYDCDFKGHCWKHIPEYSIFDISNLRKDKKFDFEIKSPPASHFIKEAAKLKGGSKEPGRSIAGSITKKQAEEIATQKMKDLNAHDLGQAVKIIAGSARSMGIEVKD